MKKAYYCIIVFCVLAFTGNAQTVNLNPDKNGEPWIAGGVPIEEFNQDLAKRVELKIRTRKISLPYMVDNSTSIYFRPIFNQADGSCAQASGIGYHYTYEVNRIRGLASNTTANQYPSHFTYNFLNDGSGENGSWYYEGWDIVKEMGVPSVAEYGGMSTGGATRWLSGYDTYYSAMGNRLIDYHSINIRNESGLETLKNYLYDHGSNDKPGGLANFSVYTDETEFGTIPPATEEGGKQIIVKWGADGGHALTIVGYNDSVKYDFNGDGKYTNDVDINNDLVVNMKDWEVGALKFANSWGTSWGDDGFCYLPYRLLALNEGNGGISSDYVFTIEAKKQTTPKLAVELDLNYTSRKNLKIYVGLMNTITSPTADKETEFLAFTNKGGDFYMQGGRTKEANKHISIGLDITPLKSSFTSGSKLVVYVNESDGSNKHEGIIERCIVHDYETGKEYNATPDNYPIFGLRNVVVVHGDESLIPKINEDELPMGAAGENYEQTLSVQGGTAPYLWSIDRAYSDIPPGMSFSNDGVFSGIPIDTSAHKWNLRFEVKDANYIKSGKVLQFELEGDYTAIASQNINSTQPYPNPFHHTVRMDIHLKKEQPVSAYIVDLSGNTKQMLLNKRLLKGTHQIEWTPENRKPGLYILHIRAGKQLKSYPILYIN